MTIVNKKIIRVYMGKIIVFEGTIRDDFSIKVSRLNSIVVPLRCVLCEFCVRFEAISWSFSSNGFSVYIERSRWN